MYRHSVIHMGDHNVPNALMFIDKYSQIYRILLPICTTISLIPELTKKPEMKKYIDGEFGGVDGCICEILGDFFRHGKSEFEVLIMGLTCCMKASMGQELTASMTLGHVLMDG